MAGRLHHARIRPVARVGHAAVVGAQLAAERLADAALGSRPRTGLDEQVTVIVKTFERPRILRRMVRSLRRLHPDVRLVVADDSRTPSAPEGAELVALPFDSGVSAGRKAALARVRTPLVAVLDDDFVLHRHSDLGRPLAALAAEPAIDILGGRVINLPRYRSADYRGEPIFPTDKQPVHPLGTLLGGLPVYDKVPTFYVARTDRLRLVDWDPALTRVDHADFFTRARGVLTTVYDEGWSCLHARTPFDAAYRRSRMNMGADSEVIRRRWYSGEGS
jgi:glycosyltransferase involved in cell wall biosynthesis